MNNNENKRSNEKIWNVPNILTLSRIIIIPFFIALIYVKFPGHYFVALGLFVIAGITDFLDGFIARKYNLVSNMGKFLDPIADKVLVLSAFVVFLTIPDFFTYNFGDWALIVGGCGVAVILAREIIISGFRLVASNSGEVIAADMIGKYKTVTQDVTIAVMLVSQAVAELTDGIAGVIINHVALVLFIMSIILTVVSGVNYIVKNRKVLK